MGGGITIDGGSTRDNGRTVGGYSTMYSGSKMDRDRARGGGSTVYYSIWSRTIGPSELKPWPL